MSKQRQCTVLDTKTGKITAIQYPCPLEAPVRKVLEIWRQPCWNNLELALAMDELEDALNGKTA